MVFTPNPGVLEYIVRDRQEQLRRRARQAQAGHRAGVRVRIGHALIVAGSMLSGEQVEIPAHESAHLRAAA